MNNTHHSSFNKTSSMKKTLFYFAFLFTVISLSASAQSSWTKEKAAAWFQSKSWLNGAAVKPHPSINQQIFAEQYHKNKADWDKAFAFFREHDLKTLADGTYPIDGKKVFASVSEYVPKSFDSSQWESHRQYIDLQCMISGEEKIGKAPVPSLKVTQPYSEEKDIAHYSGPGKYYLAEPYTFFLFFPGEAHRPNINPGKTYKQVKKIVIKIQYVP